MTIKYALSRSISSFFTDEHFTNTQIPLIPNDLDYIEKQFVLHR